MLYALCVPRWPSNFVKSSQEVTQEVEVVFSLKESPQPLDFITEVSLRDFGLAFVKGP